MSRIGWRLALLLLFLLWLPVLPAQAGPSQTRQTESPAADALGTWTPTGSMTTARWVHSLTLLPTGLVLAVGGRDAAGDFLASAELYNPATGTWTPTGSMATARAGHSATLLANGKVLVAGGSAVAGHATPVLDSVELYDPATGTWTPTASMHTARSEHRAVQLLDGKVLVIGGYNPFEIAITSTELYDPETGQWTDTGSLNVARSGEGAVLLPNGKVLVAGGFGDGSSSAELYDPATEAWTLVAPMSIERTGDVTTLLATGRVLAAGWGSAAELYDPASNTWTPTGSRSNASHDSRAVLLSNGNVLRVGGEDPPLVTALATAEIYDVASGTWSSAGSMHTARGFFHAAVLLPSGQVLVAGGTTRDGTVFDSAELYTPAALIPPALGNLLSNPGFELDADGDSHADDWTSNPAVTRSQLQIHHGSYALQHQVDLDSSYTIQQHVANLQPGLPFAFSGWVNVPSLSASSHFSLSLAVDWRDITGTITGTSTLLPITQTTQGWTFDDGVVTAPKGAASADVQMAVHNFQGTFYVDDLFFGNLLSNAGFEQDSNHDERADGWQPEPLAERTTSAVHGGSYALYLHGTDNAVYDIASTPISDIVATKQYRVSAAVKIPATSDAFHFDVLMDWQDAQGNVITNTLVRRFTKANHGVWRLMDETVTAPSGAERAVLRLLVTSLSGSIYLDDVAIYPYEPLTEMNLPFVERAPKVVKP